MAYLKLCRTHILVAYSSFSACTGEQLTSWRSRLSCFEELSNMLGGEYPPSAKRVAWRGRKSGVLEPLKLCFVLSQSLSGLCFLRQWPLHGLLRSLFLQSLLRFRGCAFFYFLLLLFRLLLLLFQLLLLLILRLLLLFQILGLLQRCFLCCSDRFCSFRRFLLIGFLLFRLGRSFARARLSNRSLLRLARCCVGSGRWQDDGSTRAQCSV